MWQHLVAGRQPAGSHCVGESVHISICIWYTSKLIGMRPKLAKEHELQSYFQQCFAALRVEKSHKSLFVVGWF